MRSLTVADGLPQGWVTQIVQDRQGFIWVASKGLSRYDGLNFKTWQHIPGDTTSLSNNDISEMHLDSHDNLWLVYYKARVIDIINTVSGQIRHISSEPAFRWLTKINPGDFFVKEEGGIFFYGYIGHLGTFDLASGQHHEISAHANEHFIAVGSDEEKNIWISSERALYQFQNGKLLLASGLPHLTKTDEDLWVHILANPTYHTAGLAISGDHVFAPAPGGVFAYNKQTGLTKYLGDHNPDDLARSLTKNFDGRIYMVINGAIYSVGNDLELRLIFSISKSLWLNHPILIDRSATLWAAAGNGTGLRLFDLQPHNFKAFNYNSGFSHDVLLPWLKNPVKDFDFSSYLLRSATDGDGNVWVSCTGLTSASGARDIEQNLIKIKKSGFDKATFKGYSLTQFTFASNGQCWAVVNKLNVHQKSLAKVNVKTGAMQLFANLPDDSNYNFEIDQYLTAVGNKICVLSLHELRLYDTITRACKVYTDKELGANGNLLMTAISQHYPSVLWIATKGSGMIQFNIKSGEIKHYKQTTGLPDDMVYFIAPDNLGYFWCSSNKGIFRFKPETGQSLLFTVKDGLSGNEFNRYHFLKTPDGHFAFGGTDGYTIFHPDSIYIDNYQTPVVIPDILVNNKPIPRQQTEESSLHRLTLNYDQNFLSLSFAGLEYNPPNRLQYRYMLQNFDKGWVKANGNNANYTFIPPGTYTFKINATNSAGIWSNSTRELIITILPPWWRTWGAYVLYLALLSGISYALYRNWLRNAMAKQQIILKEKEAEQLKSVDEMKSRFFSNITHEFRTPLSLILAPAGQMLNEGPSGGWKKQIGTIERNARQMLKLINQLMDMAKLEANQMKISLFRGEIDQFIADLTNEFREAAVSKKIKLDVQGVAPGAECLFDADKLHTILSNLLANAVKFTPSGGSVLLTFSKSPLNDEYFTVIINVEDSGPGIPPEKLPFIFDRFYQVDNDNTRNYEGTGIGLALARELTELLEGKLKVKSEVGKGTIFTLSLPVKYATTEQVPVYHTNTVDKLLPFSKSSSPDTFAAGGAVVLVTEDNEELREFIAAIFRPDYRVLVAPNGAAGLKIAAEELPDVIISDLMMPEMDGYEFCKAIKSNPATDHIAFLLLTAKTSKLSLIEGLQNQADDYLTKPFVVEELRLRVSNLLNRRDMLMQRFQEELASPAKSDTDIDPFLRTLYSIVDRHLSDSSFSVDQLASEAAVSISTLNRKLAVLIGLSASELIKKYRLKKAAELLTRGLGVAETAYEIGYDSPAHFSTIFKNVYGVAPSEYKRN